MLENQNLPRQIVALGYTDSDFRNLIREECKSIVAECLPKEPIKKDRLTIDEVSELAGQSKSLIYKLSSPKFRATDPDPIPVLKSAAGKFIRFDRMELEAWVERRFIKPANGSEAVVLLAKSANRKRAGKSKTLTNGSEK